MRGVRLIKGHAHETKEERMTLTFAIEASKPCGTKYRLAVGVTLAPVLVGVALKLAGLL